MLGSLKAATLNQPSNTEISHTLVRLSKPLFIVAMLVCFLDYPYIPAGPLNLKMAYLIFPLYVPLMLYLKKLMVDRSVLGHSVLLILCVVPSVLWSTDIAISLSFLSGTIVCIVIMWSVYELTKIIGVKTINVMVSFYRATIILTVPLVVLGIEPRGCFTLYEPSAWAIAMIPYYCIAFERLLVSGKRAFIVDGLFILSAIVLSTSVSMVLWCALSFVALALITKRIKFRGILISSCVGVVFLLASYEFNARTGRIFESISGGGDWVNLIMFLTLVGGNRIQRAYMACQVAYDHPFVGVGLGALARFTGLHFNANDFEIMGRSAYDFDPKLPSTNIVLELTAEAGILGIVGFLSLFRFVFRSVRDPESVVFRVSLFVTMVALMTESSYLRPYMWLLFGIALGYGEVCAMNIEENQSLPT